MDYSVHYAALEFFAHRWTLEILASLDERPKRFTELQRAIDPVLSPKALTDALRRLTDQKLVMHPSDGDGLRYELTPDGRRMLPLIFEFVENLRLWVDTRNGADSTTHTE